MMGKLKKKSPKHQRKMCYYSDTKTDFELVTTIKMEKVYKAR